MKVALLLCDEVTENLLDKYGDYTSMFRCLLPQLVLDEWLVCKGQFPNLNDYDAFICTGSRYSVYEDIDWIMELSTFTKRVFESSKKFVGVCFGHQMIAHALDGQVDKSDKGYLIGVHSFEILRKIPWTTADMSSFNILMLCQDQVTKLPSNSKVWASAPACPVGMYTVGSQFLGIQGHPEFTKEYNRALFESRPEKISQEKMEEAVLSLEKSPSTAFLANSICDFLRDKTKKPAL